VDCSVDDIRRPAVEADLCEVDRVFRIAFGTYEKLDNPLATFIGLNHQDQPGYNVPETFVVDRWK